MNKFEDFVGELVTRRYRTTGALAEAIGMTLSAFSRGVRQGTLSIENCLRLAETSGDHPSKILELAGKADEAALIERLYGKQIVSPGDRQLLELWRGITPKARDHLIAVLRDLADESTEKRAARKSA